MATNRVSILGHITEFCPHGIFIYFSIKLCLLCSLLKTKTEPKTASFLGVRGFFKKRRSAEDTLIGNVTQTKPRHAKYKSQSFLSRVNEYPVTSEQ